MIIPYSFGLDVSFQSYQIKQKKITSFCIYVIRNIWLRLYGFFFKIIVVVAIVVMLYAYISVHIHPDITVGNEIKTSTVCGMYDIIWSLLIAQKTL